MARKYATNTTIDDISLDEFMPSYADAYGEDVAAAEAANGDDIEGVEVPRKHSMGEDSVQLYLRAIGRIKLLTAREEIDLARRIGKGDMLAKKRLIQANLRLVVSVAKKYQ